MHPICKKLGKRIQSLRKARDWSQAVLAEKAELHPTYISGIERGLRNLSLVNLYKLANAFGVTLAELLRLPDSDSNERSAQASAGRPEVHRASRELRRHLEQLARPDVARLLDDKQVVAALSFFITVCLNCDKLDLYRKLIGQSKHAEEAAVAPGATAG